MICIGIVLAGAGASCTALRPLDPLDAGQRTDAAALDATSGPDASVDAASPDAARLDAPSPDAAGADARCAGVELCNGLDDDCDARTPDGASDPAVGIACDGPDSDACLEGLSRCADGGSVACDDATSSTPEVCDGTTDEDCDGMIDEAGALSGVTYYLDADRDTYGDSATAMSACTPPATSAARGGDCDDTRSDVRPLAAELCDGLDTDCDGLVDDGNPCPRCDTRTNAGRTYQLCARDALSWDAARMACMAMGYDLAKIESDAEQRFIETLVPAGGFTTGLWVGLHSDAAGVFTWTDGSLPVFTAWASGEPNLTSSCVRLRSTVGGLWADTGCTVTNYYLCEAP